MYSTMMFFQKFNSKTFFEIVDRVEKQNNNIQACNYFTTDNEDDIQFLSYDSVKSRC